MAAKRATNAGLVRCKKKLNSDGRSLDVVKNRALGALGEISGASPRTVF